MLYIFSTWIHKSPPRFSVPVLHVIPCSPSQTVHTFSTQMNFFWQSSTTPKCWPFIVFFFTQTVLSSDDRNLSSTYTVIYTTFSSNLMSFSNKLPGLWLCNALCVWSSRNLKWVVTICTQTISMFSVYQIKHNMDTLNSVHISHTSPHGDWFHWDFQAGADLCT